MAAAAKRRFPHAAVRLDLIQSTVQSSRSSIVQCARSAPAFRLIFLRVLVKRSIKCIFDAAFLLHVQQVLDIVTYVTMWVVSVLCKKATPRVTLLRWFKPFSIQQKCIEMYRWMACIDMSPMNTFKHVTNRDDVTFSPLKLSLHWPYQI